MQSVNLARNRACGTRHVGKNCCRPRPSPPLRVVAVTQLSPSSAQPESLSGPKERVEPQRVLIDRILHSRLADYLSCSENASTIAQPSADKKKDESTSIARQHDPFAMPSLQVDTSDVSETVETCATAHPGSVACTSTTVHRDHTTHSVVITSTTTVRLTNPKAPASMTDMEQLGYLAGAQCLQQAAANLSHAVSPAEVQCRHNAVLDLLANGKVVRADKCTNQFGHVTYKCVLEHPLTKHKMRAMVKPSVDGDADGWHRADAECSAYRLGQLLGMDYVPPCVYRRDVDVDWQHYPGATFMYWAEGGQELRERPMDKWGCPSELVLSDARILDVLIQNSDRHHGHFLWAEHWAHGTGVSPAHAGWRGALRPVFIDHAAGFRPDAYVDLRHENAFNTGPTRRISARTFLRLRCLDRMVLCNSLGDLLKPSEIDQVMHHRDEVLAYFDALIAEHGYKHVVIENGL